MDEKTIARLKQPLKIYSLPGPKGKEYKYVKGEDVISALNEAFQHNWCSEVKNVITIDGHVVVHVAITAQGITHEAFGGADVAVHKYGESQGKPVNMSNTYKSALTNSIKKASEQFGLGLNVEDYVDTNDTEYGDPRPKNEIPKNFGGPQKTQPKTTGETTVSIKKREEVKEELPIDVEQLKRLVSAVIANSDPIKEEPKKPDSLVKLYTEEQKTAQDTFPKSNTGKINAIQLGAITGMCKLRGISVTEVVVEALGPLESSGDIDINDLSYNEGVKIIGHLNGKKKLS